jgi:putative acetyltransferase
MSTATGPGDPGLGLVVRPERPDDHAAVYHVNELAFGRRVEADLVERVRAAGRAVVSLVAEEAGRVVGHILFSPVSIESPAGRHPAVGLAPMAVLPDRQRRGIGASLVRRGLEECRRQGRERVVVLGHPEYYVRFGFVPASRFGIRCEYDAPDEAFMALALRPGALGGCPGTAVYAPEFAGLG